MPLAEGGSVYEELPYWIHCVMGFGIIFTGGIFWLFWAVILSNIRGYKMVRETLTDDLDGWERNIFVRKPGAVGDLE